MVVKVRDDNGFEEIPLISILSSILPIPYGSRWNETFEKPVIFQDRDTWKQGERGSSLNNAFLFVEMFYDVVLDGSWPWFVGIFTTIDYLQYEVWFSCSWRPITLQHNPSLFIPLICHLLAMDNFWRTTRLLLRSKWKLLWLWLLLYFTLLYFTLLYFTLFYYYYWPNDPMTQWPNDPSQLLTRSYISLSLYFNRRRVTVDDIVKR